MKYHEFLEKLEEKYCVRSVVSDRTIKTDFCRIYYIPKSNAGRQEYVLVVNGDVPNFNEEPDIYRSAKMDDSNPHEIHLIFDSDLEVILTTLSEDEKFRSEHRDLIAANVLFELNDASLLSK